MKFSLVLQKLNDPILVYDGGEPKQINYKVSDKNGNFVCMLDLWEHANPSWRQLFTDDEFQDLDEILNFPREKLFIDEEIVSHANSGPVYFAGCYDSGGETNFLVYYTLYELQPSRYQCFIFAVLQRMHKE